MFYLYIDIMTKIALHLMSKDIFKVGMFRFSQHVERRRNPHTGRYVTLTTVIVHLFGKRILNSILSEEPNAETWSEFASLEEYEAFRIS